jgi:Cu2+-exporting ATPase
MVGAVSQTATAKGCRHCGTTVPGSREDDFCCNGCAFVFDLLTREGLDRSYDLKGGKVLPPVSPEVLRERDYEWLEQRVARAESACDCGSPVELALSVQGVSCVGCVWLIERVYGRQPGALRVTVDVMHGELRLQWTAGAFDAVAFARELQGFGYLIGPVQQGRGEAKRERSGLERRMGACGAFALNAMTFSLPAYLGMPPDFAFAKWFTLIAAASAALAMVVGGSWFIERSWRSLRAGVLHIDTPIALGIIAAFAGSVGGWVVGEEGLLYFDFVAIFIFLMLAGRWAQVSAVDRNRRKLMRDTSIPEEVRPVGGGEPVAVQDLTPGTRFLVRPGQTLPVSAELLSSAAAVSLEWINGESETQRREQGQLLPAGTLNAGMAEVEVAAVEGWESSALRRLLESRRETEFRDLGLERLLRVYLLVVVVVGLGGAIAWLAAGQGVVKALQVMISIYVVSCPCALGVAIPLAEELASSRAERLGVFARKLGFWKRLLRARRFVFDKTGTLTMENPALLNAGSALVGLDNEAREALRTLVAGNLHPVSRSLFDAVGPGARLEGEVTESIGDGVRLETGRAVWTLGRPGWSVQPPAAAGADAVLARDGEAVAVFSFRDSLRPDTLEEVRGLRAAGIEVAILSGDRSEKVALVAEQLGLAPGAGWQAGLTPEAKADWVRRHEPERTLFVGDGANDSLAFDAALCAGSPITARSFLERKADFVFLGVSMRFLRPLIRVAGLHRRAVRRVFAFSVSYNIAAASLGLAGMLNPLLAAILMPASSVVTMSLVGWTFRSARQSA